MKIKMSQAEWDTKFKHIEKGVRGLIYRNYSGFFRDIVRFGAFPAFVIVEIGTVEKVMMICHIVEIPSRVIPKGDDYLVTDPICHAVELSLPKEDLFEIKGLYQWDTECDWWFNNLEPQFAFDLTKQPLHGSPKQIWDSWPLEFRQKLFKKYLKEEQSYLEDTANIEPEIPGLQASNEKSMSESNRIMKTLLDEDEDDEDEEVPDLKKPIVLIDDPVKAESDEDIGFVCESCQKDVSASDPFCPNCGLAFEDSPEPELLPEINYAEFTFQALKKYATSKGIKTYRKKRDAIEKELAKLL